MRESVWGSRSEGKREGMTGDLKRVRLGRSELMVSPIAFGTWQLGGEWGQFDEQKAIEAIRHAHGLGIDLFDTAQAYGFGVSERLLAQALEDELREARDEVVIATKGGLRPVPGGVVRDSSPEFLRDGVEKSLEALGVEYIDLYQVHWPDRDTPPAETGAALAELRDEGKIRHLGISNVSVDELDRAQAMTDVVSVQNRFNLQDRRSEDVLEACAERGLAFIPWFPLAAGPLARPGGPLDRIAERHDATPSQIALAWLLHRSPAMLPIPGTSSIDHLEENVGAAQIALTDGDLAELNAAAD